MLTDVLLSIIRPRRACGVRTERRAATLFNQSCRCVLCCDEAKRVAIPAEDVSKVGVTNPCGALKHRCKGRFNVAGGIADDL